MRARGHAGTQARVCCRSARLRHALKDELGGTVEHGPVRHVRVARDPPAVGCAEEPVILLQVKYILGGGRRVYHVTASSVQHALRLTSRPASDDRTCTQRGGGECELVQGSPCACLEEGSTLRTQRCKERREAPPRPSPRRGTRPPRQAPPHATTHHGLPRGLGASSRREGAAARYSRRA